MEDIQLINNTDDSHEELVLELLQGAEEIHFASGFFRESGYEILKDKLRQFVKTKGTQSTFYLGLGWGETQPKALKSLYSTLKGKDNHQMVLCTPISGIFHSKIYLFRKEDDVSLIVGSANMTKMGFSISDEASLLIKTSTESSIYKEVSAYLANLKGTYFEDDVFSLIERYENELESYNKGKVKTTTFKFRRKVLTPGAIDLELLGKYFRDYPSSDDYRSPEDREQQYTQARAHLLELASDKDLTQERINALFGQLVGHKEYKPKLWYSGSIHRKTKKSLDYPEALRDIVRKAFACSEKEEGIAFNELCDYVTQLRDQGKITGLGRNVLTEMLLSINPHKFANLNDNPLAALKKLGQDFPNPASFKSDTYTQYVLKLKEIMDYLEMGSFLEIDSFFNYVYWLLKEESNE